MALDNPDRFSPRGESLRWLVALTLLPHYFCDWQRGVDLMDLGVPGTGDEAPLRFVLVSCRFTPHHVSWLVAAKKRI